MKSIGILWVQYGPYHFARVAALRKEAGPIKIHALEFANRTLDYQWQRSSTEDEVIALCPNAVGEQLSFGEVFRSARKKFAELGLDVCILPSYAPKQSLAALLAAKSLGIRTVMMNESHAGTARARGLAAILKRRLVSLFDAALVGGHPQKRYIADLGFPLEKIFTGYDSVDNNYFSTRAEMIRKREQEIRREYKLPDRYFLSLGRFVAKKNLTTLIHAYRKVLDAVPGSQIHLVMVGSGEDESTLRKLCLELRLPVYEKTKGAQQTNGTRPGVHFFGFRQIEDNPVFYALADVFVLPSVWEEWGLVVNEAMACGLPVVVSETAGCAEDLLNAGKVNAAAALSEPLRERLAQLAGRVRRNGFVFNPRSVQSLANALIVLESVPILRESMGAVSRSLVERFSCENFARNALTAARVAIGDRLPACAAVDLASV